MARLQFVTICASALAVASAQTAAAGNTPPNPGDNDYSVPYRAPIYEVRERSDALVVRAITAAKAQRFGDGVVLLRHAAGLGNGRAMTLLGDAHASGRGVERGDVEAVRWYRAGADAGDHRAMLALGIAYGRGLGVGPDRSLAGHWLRLARETDEGGIRVTANRELRRLKL